MRAIPSLRASRPYLVLLVDDNAHGVLARKSILEELGYQVITAESGAEALELAEQRSFDLVITDYRMPVMNGTALIRTLRDREFRKPIILLSGFLSHLGLTEKSTGADLLIQKSANEMDHLLRGVKRLLATPKKATAPKKSAVPKKPAASQTRVAARRRRIHEV
jgi:CheY-like chemotaxis protein